jgi:hypothetical protein
MLTGKSTERNSQPLLKKKGTALLAGFILFLGSCPYKIKLINRRSGRKLFVAVNQSKTDAVLFVESCSL